MAEDSSLIRTNDKAHKLVTKENVTLALKADKGPESCLESFDIKDFTQKGDNYAAFVTSVKVKYTLNGNPGTVSYVLKLNPCMHVESMEPFTTMIFKKESSFYEILAPELNEMLVKSKKEPLRIAKCYYSSCEKKKEIIFLEDMREKNFKMFDRKVGLDVPHTTLILQELARLHAASVLLADKHGTADLLTKYDFLQELFIQEEPAAKEMFTTFFESFIKTGSEIADRMPGYDHVSKFLTGMVNKPMEILEDELKNKNPKFTVIGHGDCWNNNLLFRYDEDGKPLEVCVLDMQVNRVSSCTLDLNYLFYSSLNGDVRKDNLHSFFKTYHTTFESVVASVGKPMRFTVEELESEFRSHNLFALLMALMVVPIVLMESADTIEFDDISEENMNEKMEEGRQKTLDMIDTSPNMRPRFLDMFDDFTETGLIPK